MNDDQTLMTNRACPACSALDASRPKWDVPAESYFSERFGFTTARIVKCRNCGLVYTNPIPAPAVLETPYREAESYTANFPDSAEKLWWEDQAVCLAELAAQVGPGLELKILDFGCGKGGFVYLCQKMGWNAGGVELDEGTVEKASRLGVANLAAVPIEQIDASSYDVVTSIHVFEHLPDCYPIVAEFRRILRPGGIALVMVPSYDAFRSRLRAHRYWNTPYQHMNGFTGRALDILFGSHGFRKRRLCARWLGPVPGVGWRGRASTLLAKHAGNLFGFYPTKLLAVYEGE